MFLCHYGGKILKQIMEETRFVRALVDIECIGAKKGDKIALYDSDQFNVFVIYHSEEYRIGRDLIEPWDKVLPTAEEYFKSRVEPHPLLSTMNTEAIYEIMRDFTIIHLEQQVKLIAEKVDLTEFAAEFLQEAYYDAIDKETIFNAYPVSNVK